MSGGVDSLRTAILLQEQGHDVFGIHMRFLPGDDEATAGILAERENLLRELAEKCRIPLLIVDLRRQFESLVIQPFVEAYLKGLTPNPCVTCNPGVKFGLLLQEALKHGADRIATGHYARIIPPETSGNGRYQLARAADTSRDQSYFLTGLSQDQLAHALFPLCKLTKKETQAWAGQKGLDRLITEDSQEICFIPSGKYTEFLRSRTGEALSARPGPVLDLDGNLLGGHKGIHSYTVGQRRGLGIPSTEPYYVVSIEPETNTVRVGRSKDLFLETFTVSNVNWVSIPCPEEPISCQVRIRNLHKPSPAEVTPLSETMARVRFMDPQRAVTPGQAAVFYSDALLLGGGIIQRQ